MFAVLCTLVPMLLLCVMVVDILRSLDRERRTLPGWLPLIPFLAIMLTLASLLYMEPPDCHIRSCAVSEQKAGFPLPIIMDSPGGGSPTDSWGKVDLFVEEDLETFNPLTFLGNTIFYSLLLLLAWRVWLLWHRRR